MLKGIVGKGIIQIYRYLCNDQAVAHFHFSEIGFNPSAGEIEATGSVGGRESRELTIAPSSKPENNATTSITRQTKIKSPWIESQPPAVPHSPVAQASPKMKSKNSAKHSIYSTPTAPGPSTPKNSVRQCNPSALKQRMQPSTK